jgi:lysophospholipase L1-like esterase
MKKILSISIPAILIIVLVISGLSHHGTTKTHTKPLKNYVALGDSVAAGVGLETYSDSSACDRTNQSYPNLVAHSLDLKLSNFACSGATLPSGILGKQNVNQLMVRPQLNQLFSQPKPYLITLTIGANDVQWTSFIAKCYAGTCGTADDTASVNALLAKVSTNLQNTLYQIQTHYQPALPHLIVTGYHQVFPASDKANCSDLSGISPTEMTWARQQQTNLNNTISSVISHFSFARFAAINFDGHELCTTDSWVQGIDDNVPYHPTDAGQAAYAKSVVATNKLYK